MLRSQKRQWVRCVTWLASVAAASGLVASNAAAQNLALQEMAALLVLPVLTGNLNSAVVTSITVTNAGGPVRLHMNVLSGDPEDRWRGQDFDCLVTRNETVLFYIQPNGGGSSVSYECGRKVFPGSGLAARNGVMIVTLEDPVTGSTLNTNQLFGDAVVIDYTTASAYSVGAIAFQGEAATPGVVDRQYRFDNLEYSRFPSALATNYVPSRSGSLVLFTLDGTPGTPIPPKAALSIKYSLGSGGTASTSHQFDCFDIVDLGTLVGRFGIPDLSRRGGHMVLRPQQVTYPDLAHDAQFDGGPDNVLGVRTPPVHGWIFQTVDGPPMAAGTGAFGRTLAQSLLALTPSPGDVAVLNAP